MIFSLSFFAFPAIFTLRHGPKNGRLTIHIILLLFHYITVCIATLFIFSSSSRPIPYPSFHSYLGWICVTLILLQPFIGLVAKYRKDFRPYSVVFGKIKQLGNREGPIDGESKEIHQTHHHLDTRENVQDENQDQDEDKIEEYYEDSCNCNLVGSSTSRNSHESANVDESLYKAGFSPSSHTTLHESHSQLRHQHQQPQQQQGKQRRQQENSIETISTLGPLAGYSGIEIESPNMDKIPFAARLAILLSIYGGSIHRNSGLILMMLCSISLPFGLYDYGGVSFWGWLGIFLFPMVWFMIHFGPYHFKKDKSLNYTAVRHDITSNMEEDPIIETTTSSSPSSPSNLHSSFMEEVDIPPRKQRRYYWIFLSFGILISIFSFYLSTSAILSC